MGFCASFSILHESGKKLFISEVSIIVERTYDRYFRCGEHGRLELVRAPYMLDSRFPNGPVGLPDYGRRTLLSKAVLGWLRYYTTLTYI